MWELNYAALILRGKEQHKPFERAKEIIELIFEKHNCHTDSKRVVSLTENIACEASRLSKEPSFSRHLALWVLVFKSCLINKDKMLEENEVNSQLEQLLKRFNGVPDQVLEKVMETSQRVYEINFVEYFNVVLNPRKHSSKSENKHGRKTRIHKHIVQAAYDLAKKYNIHISSTDGGAFVDLVSLMLKTSEFQSSAHGITKKYLPSIKEG